MTASPEMVGAFLRGAGWGDAAREPLAGDWSTRRYERLRLGGRTAILMDAGDGRVDAFVRIDRWLRSRSLHAPEILGEDAALGLLLLEDLGDDLVARAIAGGADERLLYDLAVGAVLRFQESPPPEFLPPMTDSVLIGLLDLFLDLGGPELDEAERQTFRALWAGLLPRARLGDEVFLHRDYHAENLLWLPHEAGLWRLGLIDFQDAFAGPALYDLVSLVQDARRDVSPEVVEAVTRRYLAARPALDPEAAGDAIAILGGHRAMRILGVVGRLSRLRARSFPEGLVARVEGHLRAALGHPAMAELRRWLRQAYPTAAFSR